MQIELIESVMKGGVIHRPGSKLTVSNAFGERAIAKGWAKKKGGRKTAEPSSKPAKRKEPEAPAENPTDSSE